MWIVQGVSDRWRITRGTLLVVAVTAVGLGAGCQGSELLGPQADLTGAGQAAGLAAVSFTAASGTVTQTEVLSESVRFAGPNTIVELVIAGTVTGTLSGTVEDSFTLIIHPNATFTAQGTTTCVCTVDGRSGVLHGRLTDTGEIINGAPQFQGRWVILAGTDDLSGLRGVLQVDGAVDLATGFSTTEYSGWIQFQF